jgi:hypothetical protein
VSLLAATAGRVAPEGVDFQNDRHSVRASRLLQHAPDKGSRPQVDHPCDRHHINNWPGSLGGQWLTEYDGGEERKSDNPPSAGPAPCRSRLLSYRPASVYQEKSLIVVTGRVLVLSLGVVRVPGFLGPMW